MHKYSLQVLQSFICSIDSPTNTRDYHSKFPGNKLDLANLYRTSAKKQEINRGLTLPLLDGLPLRDFRTSLNALIQDSISVGLSAWNYHNSNNNYKNNNNILILIYSIIHHLFITHHHKHYHYQHNFDDCHHHQFHQFSIIFQLSPSTRSIPYLYQVA
mgnify:CR=1 FL=1